MNQFLRLAFVLTAFCSLNAFADRLSEKADLNTLIHVHAVWRHGDRTPSILIPTGFFQTFTF